MVIFTSSMQQQLQAGVWDWTLRDPALYRAYYLTAHWRRTRARKLAEALVCEKCGCRSSVHVHHRTYRRFFRELMGDLSALCESCHFQVHDREF